MKRNLSCSVVLHLLSRSCLLDAERLVIVRAVGLDTRCAVAIEDAIIRKAQRLLAVLTLLKTKGA